MTTSASITRRQLLRGHPHPAGFRPRPPGVVLSALSLCTRCGDCAEACPENLIVIADDGVALVPERGECILCGACADACEAEVFSSDQVMAHRFEISQDCLAYAGIACMACRDACPQDAISMLPRIGVPFTPELDAEVCNGCGACVAPCPGAAIRAVGRGGGDV